jgi:hypothetical protein
MESIGPHSLSGCCPNSDTRDLKLGQSAWNQYRLTAAAMPLLHPPKISMPEGHRKRSRTNPRNSATGSVAPLKRSWGTQFWLSSTIEAARKRLNKLSKAEAPYDKDESSGF